MIYEKIEKRRLALTCVKRKLAGLSKNFEGLNVHKKYLNGLEIEEFRSGMDALAQALGTLYTGMIN